VSGETAEGDRGKQDLIFHPVRLRIIAAISNQQVTAHDLAAALPDVPLTTLYRHLNALAKGGILNVVAENPIRGTVERVYRLSSPSLLNETDLRGMPRQDCERAFNVFVSALLSDARRYLDTKEEGEAIDLVRDGVEVSKVQLWLSDKEHKALNREMLKHLVVAAENAPAAGRRRRVYSYVSMPVD
jgi:DNA-binding transcriptional ArsR family regulator